MTGLLLLLTSSDLALILPGQEVLEQVPQELQRDVLEGEGWAVEQLEQVQVALQVPQGRDLVVPEGRVAPVDDPPEVFGRDLGARDVQGQDVEGELGEGQVFPVLPVRGGGDLLGDVQAAVVGEALEDDILEGELRIATRLASGPSAARGMHVARRCPRHGCSDSAGRECGWRWWRHRW